MNQNDKMYKELSRQCREYLMSGKLDLYSVTLKRMAEILDIEEKYVDEVKSLMVAFYIDLSGVGHSPYIDRLLVESMNIAIRKSNLRKGAIKDLYFETVREDTTPRHTLTLKQSFRVFQLVFWILV